MNPLSLEKAFKFFKKFPTSHVFHRLPNHYKKYLISTFDDPLPVHYVPVTKEWIKDPKTGEKKRVADVPIPLIFPKEANEGLWGGEGVIKGFIKKDVKYASRIPRWWTPLLKRAIVYSEILNQHLSVIVTERTLELIDQAYGFDNYILKTRVVDLRSLLGLKIRKEILLALIHKSTYTNDPRKQQEIHEKYKEFIVPEQELEWMGLTLTEALNKQKAIEAAQARAIYPLKGIFRKELLESLKEMDAVKASDAEADKLKQSWFNKWNPFSKGKSQDEVQPKT